LKIWLRSVVDLWYNPTMEKDKDKSPQKPKKKVAWQWRIVMWLFTLGLVALAAAGVYILLAFLEMPSLDSMLHETRTPAITFIDKDGYEIRSNNKIMGSPVSVSGLPPYVWQAMVAIEDKRFFDHGATDIRGMTRSVLSNLRAGAVVAGGSSLTQQTAKNIFLSPRRTIKRKVQEVILSYWLENRFTKEQILDLYMNRVSLVKGMRGIDAAARELFQKTAKDLSLAEAAQIAAMLKAPTAYSPMKNPDKNIARARVVLVEMVRQKFITLDAARAAAADLHGVTPAPDTNVFRYWTDYVGDEVAGIIGDNVSSDLLVYTTLDSDMQEHVAAVIRRKIADARDKRAGQAATVAMSRDGALRAMVGGTNYQSSQFNRALALRQPGSTFKLVVYLVALENGMTPDAMVNDSQFAIGDYHPKNYNEKFYGDITLGTAFAKSVNSVPLKLAEKFGLNAVLKMAGRLGVGANLRREYSSVIGSSEMTLVNLTAMYNTVWNNGYAVRPYAILKILTPSGQVLYQRDGDGGLGVLSDDTTGYMTGMLAGVLRASGTGHRAAAAGAIGGKTGTSNDYRDAWFVGATNDLTIGVWVGNDDFSPMSNITGGTIPAEIFKDIVD